MSETTTKEFEPITAQEEFDERIKYRMLADAWEEYRRINEERYG